MAQDGHTVIGVDVNPVKVDSITSGRSPIIEPGLDELIASGIESGQISGTTDGQSAVLASDISIICVGTPSNENGSLNLKYIENVCREIGMVLARKDAYHVVVIRSTVIPGTVREKLIPILEHYSQKRAGQGFGVCMNPEFMRESSAIADYYHPSHVIIGSIDDRSGDMLQPLYEKVHSPVVRTTLETAEMVKYADNSFHALKVSFANEIGSFCKAHGIDGREVMEIFCQDTRLNISPVYLRPGYSFGGSCLPKDVRALMYRAKEKDVDMPVTMSILPSNHRHTQRGIQIVERLGRGRKIGMLGLSFKADTDDVRESPMIAMLETLIGRGFHVHVFDEFVDPDTLIGANREFLLRELPHIVSIMRKPVESLVVESDILIVTNTSETYRRALDAMRADQILIDLAGIREANTIRGIYEGICW
jgi:GDP-mannose 6-dehydrogenase